VILKDATTEVDVNSVSYEPPSNVTSLIFQSSNSKELIPLEKIEINFEEDPKTFECISKDLISIILTSP
jgi:hypothetical protein